MSSLNSHSSSSQFWSELGDWLFWLQFSSFPWHEGWVTATTLLQPNVYQLQMNSCGQTKGDFSLEKYKITAICC